MTPDDEFVARLQELDAKKADGLPEMRELLRNGNLSRLIALAARGVAPIKRAGRISLAIKTRVADGFPDQSMKDRAVIYWGKKRRPDLVARVEDIAEDFHNHYLANGEKAESWPAKWQTWTSRALEFNKPPRDGGLFPIAPVFEQTGVAGWVARLQVYYSNESRTWPATWGAKPAENPNDAIPSGCRCPAQAFALYLAQTKRRA